MKRSLKVRVLVKDNKGPETEKSIRKVVDNKTGSVKYKKSENVIEINSSKDLKDLLESLSRSDLDADIEVFDKDLHG